MALYDWNRDGKKDSRDNYIEYQIYNTSTENKEERSSYSGSRSSLLNYACIVFVIVLLIGAIFEPLGWLILIVYGLAVLFTS